MEANRHGHCGLTWDQHLKRHPTDYRRRQGLCITSLTGGAAQVYRQGMRRFNMFLNQNGRSLDSTRWCTTCLSGTLPPDGLTRIKLSNSRSADQWETDLPEAFQPSCCQTSSSYKAYQVAVNRWGREGCDFANLERYNQRIPPVKRLRTDERASCCHRWENEAVSALVRKCKRAVAGVTDLFELQG